MQNLNKYQPRAIKTEEENEVFLAIAEELMACPQLTVEEGVFLELLVRLIEEFEKKHYAIGTSTPHSRLLHLMEAHSLNYADLVPVLGSIEVSKAVVEEQSQIDLEQASALGQFFHIDPRLFFVG